MFLRLNFTYYLCIYLFWMYMCFSYTYAYPCVFVYVCVCVCLILCTWNCVQIHVFTWGWCWLPSFIVLHLIFWSKVSFTSEISYPICMFLPMGYRWVTMPTWQLHVFRGIEFYPLLLWWKCCRWQFIYRPFILPIINWKFVSFGQPFHDLYL